MYRPKATDDEATKTFLRSVTTTREIRKPIEVSEYEKKKPQTADEYEITYNPETDKNHPYEKFRRKPIYKCLVSREIARYLDRRTFIAVSVREAFLYIIFLILITIITFGSTPLDMFYFSQAMTTLYTKQQFKSETHLDMQFYDINSFSDIWQYELSIIQKLYHDFWFSKPVPYENPEQGDEFFYENKLIGMPQIRQVRVRNETCDVADGMEGKLKDCYGPYTAANEDKESFTNMYGTYWEYKPASETKSWSIPGSLATYEGGGFVAVLQNVGDKPLQTIFQLRNNMWLDRATRAVFIEFAIYNGNVNLFCIFKLIFEVPPTGGVIPSHWNYVQKLIRYNDSDDYFILVCEIIMGMFLIFFTLQKLLECLTLKGKLWKSLWHYVDLVILIACYLTIVFNILLYVVVHSQLPEMVKPENEMKYASFDEMSYIHTLYSYAFAILIAFAFFRLLKYLNIVHAMYQLQATISRSVRDTLSYAVMFIYVYSVFAMFGVFLFGNKIEDYKNFSMAIFALLRSSVGDFNYHKLVQADPVIGPIFFFCFVFFMIFILVNIFLAILVSKYEEVRSEVRIGGAKTFIWDMIKYWGLRFLEKMECNWILSQMERRRFEKKIRSPTEAIRQYLRQAGYSELEIELFFKKYDITDAKITAMDEDRVSFRQEKREAPPPLSQKDILRYIVIQKLEYLENHYKSAKTLIDEFLVKLNKFDIKKRN